MSVGRGGRRGPLLLVLLLVLSLVGIAVAATTATGSHAVRVSTATPAAGPPATAAACTARRGEYTAAHLDEVYRQLKPIFDLAGEVVAPGPPSIQLDLGTGEDALAALIEARYGAAVALSVAGVPYCHGPGPNPACPSAPPGQALPAGLHLSLRIHRRDIDPIQTVSGSLLIHWTGHGTFSMGTSQPLLADTYSPGTDHVVAIFSGSVAGTGESVRLRTGQSKRIDVIVGTSRCGGRDSALPAGKYTVRVALGTEGPRPGRSYLSPPVALQVSPF